MIRRRFLLAGLVTVLGACTKESAGHSASDSDTGTSPPFEDLFSVVVVTDHHLTGGKENLSHLEAALAWVNDNAASENIALLVTLGDIAWGDGFDQALGAFGALSVPWVPVIGDNEIQDGDEQTFAEVYAPQYERLGVSLEGWRKAPTPVKNPDVGKESWFQNFSFNLQGVHVVGLDWCARVFGGLAGEAADLHDFEGGTLPWLVDDLAGYSSDAQESVMMLSHHPMHLSPAAFDLAEMATLSERLTPRSADLDADYAGHYHLEGDETLEDEGWDVHITDATFESPVHLRLIRVSGNGRTVAYEQVMIDLEDASP